MSAKILPFPYTRRRKIVEDETAATRLRDASCWVHDGLEPDRRGDPQWVIARATATGRWLFYYAHPGHLVELADDLGA